MQKNLTELLGQEQEMLLVSHWGETSAGDKEESVVELRGVSTVVSPSAPQVSICLDYFNIRAWDDGLFLCLGMFVVVMSDSNRV